MYACSNSASIPSNGQEERLETAAPQKKCRRSGSTDPHGHAVSQAGSTASAPPFFFLAAVPPFFMCFRIVPSILFILFMT
jgi:hypothetical protein